MNAGFSNLTTLKAELLLPGDAAKTTYDMQVLDLGLGVASMFEDVCGRKFARLVDATLEFPANRRSLVVPRYPIEAVNGCERRGSLADGWSAVEGEPANTAREAGLVMFSAELGLFNEVARLTWTGGYWWATAEPTDSQEIRDADVLPAGAEPLPRAIKSAWLLQCKNFWDQRNLIDRAKAGVKSGEGLLGGQTKLLPVVLDALRPYWRMA